MNDAKAKMFELFMREYDAAHAAMDRKERELDEYGYGGAPGGTTAGVLRQLMELEPSRDDLVARLDRIEVAALEVCDFLARMNFASVHYGQMVELTTLVERLRGLAEAEKR